MKTFSELQNIFEQIKKHKSPEEIAKKHKVSLSFIEGQLKIGIPIEKEHTLDRNTATIIALQHLDEFPDYYTKLKKMEVALKKESKPIEEGTLHHWFKGSRSKKGKPGWVQADGSPCANEPGETSTPKCFSSARLTALKKKGKKGKQLIKSAVSRKREIDKNQQEKSGAQRPTYVRTFSKGKEDPNYIKAEPGIKKSKNIKEAAEDKPSKGSGKKDACYYKVKSRFKVWPSAYGSGQLVQCRKKGAASWGNKSSKKNVSEDYTRIQATGNTYAITIMWMGKPKIIQMFFPNLIRPTRKDVAMEINKVYPNAVVLNYIPSPKDPTKPYLFAGDCNA